MTIRVGINGFGRIGRQVFRAIDEHYKGKLEVAVVNDLTDPETNAHLLRWDSNYGRYPGKVEVNKGCLVVNNVETKVLAERDPEKIEYNAYGVGIVIE